MGVIGVQLWFHANGVDESNVREPYTPQSKGLGNSQILPRNYTKQDEIELLLSEMAEQVAIRLRRSHQQTRCVSVYIGFAKESYFEQRSRGSFQAQIEDLSRRQLTDELTRHVIKLFRKHYKGEAVRQIGVQYSQFIPEPYNPFPSSTIRIRCAKVTASNIPLMIFAVCTVSWPFKRHRFSWIHPVPLPAVNSLAVMQPVVPAVWMV